LSYEEPEETRAAKGWKNKRMISGQRKKTNQKKTGEKMRKTGLVPHRSGEWLLSD